MRGSRYEQDTMKIWKKNFKRELTLGENYYYHFMVDSSSFGNYYYNFRVYKIGNTFSRKLKG